MATSVHLVMWGSRTEQLPADAQQAANPARRIREHLQRALATRYPMSRLYSLRVRQEERLVDGLLCMGYSITLAIAILPEPDLAYSPGELEARMESLLSVALLRLYCPVHVDAVWVASEGEAALG